MSGLTDEDEHELMQTLCYAPSGHLDPWVDTVEAIVARHVAAALTEAAKALPDETEGPDRYGTAHWPDPHHRDIYSLAIEEAQSALRKRTT